MSNRNEFVFDPLGFTKETAALLNGLNCSNLRKFKKKNIGLDDLKLITREDLKILEVDEEFDFESFNRLQQSLIRKHRKLAPKHCPADVLKIIENVHMQLKVLEVYIKFTYHRLLKHKNDDFINKNKKLKVSQALVVASNCVLKELEELDRAMKNMQLDESKHNSNTKRKIITCSIIIGGLGIITLFFIKR